MSTNRAGKPKFWRALIAAQAAIWFLIAALRILNVLSFRMKYVPMLALILLLADLLLFAVLYDRRHRHQSVYRQQRRTFCVLLLVTLAASIPLFTDYIVDGNDIQFHLFRMEGIKDGLMDGQFPVRIHPNTLYGNGYANPQFYPELLLYVPAALRLCGFSIMSAYKTFLFCLNAFTAYVAYVSFSRMFRSRRVGIVGSALYTLSLYRLINLYTRAAVGEASAMAFFPLVAYGLSHILTADPDRPGYRWSFLPLALGMTGLVATHLLSCEMALPLLAIVCLLYAKRTFQPKRLLAIGKAAGTTVLLSLCFLVPMLDYLSFDTYQVFHYSVTNRAHEALNVAQLFPLLPNGMGESIPLSDGIATEMPLGLGFVAALILLAFPVLRARAKNAPMDQTELLPAGTRMPRTCFALACITLFMTTHLFPWEGVYRLGGICASLASMLQFPWRMLGPATLFVTLVGCACWQLLPSAVPERTYRLLAAYTLCLFLLITPLAYCDRLLQQSDALHISFFEDLDQTSSVGDAEYLPYGASGMESYRVDTPLHATEGILVESFSRLGTHAAITLQNNASKAGSVDLPLIDYLGYAASDEQGAAFDLTKGEQSRIRLIVPAGYAGTVEIAFAERPLWRVAEVISLLSALALLVCSARARRRETPPQNGQ